MDRESFFKGFWTAVKLGRHFVMGLISKFITRNGTYIAANDGADGYSTVTVDVPPEFTAADEGKVVENGALVAQTSRSIDANGTYDTTLNNSVVVNVSGGGGTSVVLSGYGAPDSGLGNDGNIYLEVEMDVAGTPTSDNPDGLSISSTSFYPGYEAYKAFGQNSGWMANGTTGAVFVSLLAGSIVPQKISFVDAVRFGGPSYIINASTTIEASNNGTNWDTLYEKQSASSFGEITEVDLTQSQILAYKMFKFSCVGQGNVWCGLKGVSIVGYDPSGNTGTVTSSYCKVSGAWQPLIGTDILDVTH